MNGYHQREMPAAPFAAAVRHGPTTVALRQGEFSQPLQNEEGKQSGEQARPHP